MLAGGKAPWLNSKPASANFCRASVQVLNSALGSAEKRGLVTYNAGAMRLLELPDEGDDVAKEIVPLTTDQAADLMVGIHEDERERLSRYSAGSMSIRSWCG